MKLEKILSKLNSFEKNSFLKVIDGVISLNPKNQESIDQILTHAGELKNTDNSNIVRVFELLTDEFQEITEKEFLNTESQLDILIDIISKEGNGIMKTDWFSRLYENKIVELQSKIIEFSKIIGLDNESATEISNERLRDYKIYLRCLRTAYFNDEENNQDKKITNDELSILKTLSKELKLSKEEIKLINYLILPIRKLSIEEVINELKTIGVIFYSKKQNTVYIADEVVHILRKIRGKEVSSKYIRRVLKTLKEPQINLICKTHGIDRKLDYDLKIKKIIDEGISLKDILLEDVHKPNTTLTEKKKFLNDIIENKLKISDPIRGLILDDKVQNLINYFNEKEKEEKVGISIEGYQKLLSDIREIIPELNNFLRNEFEFQDENVLNSDFLLDFNIKPRDILELMSSDQINLFCQEKSIKTRGDIYSNILDHYKDSENLFLENYSLIAFRDLNKLKENGISVKEVDLGLLFEDLTAKLFEGLGFNVNTELKNSLNTSKDKSDIIISMEDNEIIIIECKTVKEHGYNKFSSVSRQLKSYTKRANEKGYKVIKSLLIAPEFSDEFIKECGLDYELNLSLISANSLLNIHNSFKQSKLKKFPHNLFMRDVLILEERIIKAIER